MRRACLVWAALIVLPRVVDAAESCPQCVYRERDPKTLEHRREGLRRVPTAGDLIVLSFMARPAGRLDGRERLHVRFHVPAADRVFITATERQAHGLSSYCMKPEETSWSAGWHEFTWPAAAVVQPARVDLNALAIVARLGVDGEGSGTFAPAALHGGELPPFRGEYSVWLLSTSTLDDVTFVLGRESDGKVIASHTVHDKPANVPFEWPFTLRGEKDGAYVLLVNGTELNHVESSGPALKLRFEHRSRLAPGPRAGSRGRR